MQKSIFLFFCLFCFSNAFAMSEKAYIIFSAGLNEIENQDKGSYPELASLLQTYRQKKTPVFFIFGGASLFPSVLSSFDHGAHIIALLNSLEPDVMAANKGDFAFSEDELSLRSYEAAFPIVQSNIIEKKTGRNLDGILNSDIIEQGPYKLGFISVMDKIDLEAYNLMNLKIKEAHLAVKQQAQALRQQGADFIIMHYGGRELNCLEFIEDGSVDLVLRNYVYRKASDDYKAQTHSRQIFLSQAHQAAVVELNWEKNKPATLKIQGKVSPLLAYPKHLNIEQQIAGYNGQLAVLLNEKIGDTRTHIDLSYENLRIKENGFANLIADVIKENSGAEVALINSGMIRGEGVYLQNSPISRRDIIKILPYRDKIVLLETTGAQLLNALENGFSQIEKINGRFPQVAGMKIIYNSQAKVGERVISVTINHQPLDPDKSYKLATTQFIADGGDGYLIFKQRPRLRYNQQVSALVSDILINQLRLTNSIAPEIDSRIKDIATHTMEQQ